MNEYTEEYSEAARLGEFIGLPDDTFTEWGLTVVGFMDKNGDARFETNLYGAHSATQIIGVLEIVKAELVGMQHSVDEDD